MSEELWNIPATWEWTTLNRLGDIVGGGTPSTKEPEFWGDGINWISPSDLTGYTSKTIAHGAKNITQSGLDNSGARVMPRGSVHFSSRAPIGYVVISAAPLATNQGFKSLVPSEGIFNEFVYYYLKSSTGMARERASGTTFLELSGAAFGVLPIPVAPTNEQRRIVAKIEELFSELDKGIESLTTAREQLKAYRQSVLKYAFDEATESRLLPTVLAEPFSNGYSGKPVQKVTPWRVLSLSATTSGVFNGEYYKYLDEPGLESRDIWCEPGDVLVQRGNTIEYVGVPALYMGKSKEFIFPDLMIRLRANPDIISPAYLCYAMSTPAIRDEMRSRAKGSAGTMPKISQKILAELKIPYCKSDVQRKITQQIDTLNSHASAFEANVEIQLAKSNALRHSILKQAFSGQLVKQDAKDEPASVLLERIRAERDTSPAKNGRRKISKNGKKQFV